jgi:hypothetical protein
MKTCCEISAMLIAPFLVVNLFLFGFTVWLGAYLLARNSSKPAMYLTGWGLLVYAAALAIEILGGEPPRSFLLLPGLFWIGATLYLFPEGTMWRLHGIRIWAMAFLPLFILSLVNCPYSAPDLLSDRMVLVLDFPQEIL